MGIFDRFPYSSTHEMNLDFMLGKATEIAESLQEVQDGLSDIDTHKAQAEQAAQDAAQAKQAAQSAAQTASASAVQAAQHKTDAADAADRAEAASNLADDAVEQAQTAAQNASTAADGAIASATAAENRINAAAAQAQTDVQAAATQAQTNVQTAADSAVASATAAENRINALAESLPEDFTELNNEVSDLKSALNKSVGLSKSTAKALNNTIVIEHQETVEANTGGHVYMFDTPIPEGATVKISNLSANASISVNAFKIDGTYETVVSSLGYGMSTSVVASFDMFGVRSYVGAGTDWHIKFEYGNTGANSLVFFSIDQSSKTSEEKQTARNNIGAASQEDVEQIQNDILLDNNTNIFDTTLSNGYIKWSDGTTDSSENAKYSDYIAVEAGDVITYSLHAIGGVGAVIACYDGSYAYQQNKSVKGIGNGSWQENTGTLTIENGTSFIRFATNSGYLTSDSIVQTKKTKLKDYIAEIEPNVIWNGKSWAAFGTSITDTSYQDVHFLQPTGKYIPFLAEMSGMVVHNYGIAGASIMPNIKDKVLSTNIANEEIITVEGSVNDHATSKPLGEIGDKTADTFAGCIYLIAKYVYENSNATLFFITDYVGRYVHINPAPDGSDFYGDCSPGKTNTLGLKQIDYINMMKAQCEYFSIPCIDAGQKCSINELTGNLYLMDHIHSSYVGGKQYAQTIWDELKLKKPRVLSV